MIKKIIKSLFLKAGYEIKAVNKQLINKKTGKYEGSLYRPLYSPWFGDLDFIGHYKKCSEKSLVSPDRCFIIYKALLQAISKQGDLVECGVYKGGTAAMMASCLSSLNLRKKLYLFDTFEGMPETDSKRDLHKKGDFADTSLDVVMQYVGHADVVEFKKGFIPNTFEGMENSKFCFAHIDVDIYRSILDAMEFIWPRLESGGFVIFDDYGFPTCPGAREAVDEFFSEKASIPICLPTGQAIVIKA
jgi:O-methyltransferase